ncbi:MAG: Protein-glutamate methylesterase/protein-glutamine glutaminase [Holosporales bacterium]
MKKKVRVLVVDDSSYIRHIVSQIINESDDLEVVGDAVDPFDAREKIKILNPDVITLDVEMPKMNGIDFLEKLMRLRPMPVVMLSTLTDKGADVTIKALELGAVDYIKKPTKDFNEHLQAFKKEVVEKVRMAASAKIRIIENPADKLLYKSSDQNQHNRLKGFERILPAKHAIIIGSSTGGVEALSSILTKLPENAPAILIAQHMPEGFTASFAKRLNSQCAIRIVEAQSHMRIEPKTAYIAPGNAHMRVEKISQGYAINLDYDTPLVSGHRPSVDVLFESVSHSMGSYAVGFILTGMGKDGALGLKKMRDVGCKTFGQNEASCVVYGMPKMAMQMGAVEKEVDLSEIPTLIMQQCL